MKTSAIVGVNKCPLTTGLKLMKACTSWDLLILSSLFLMIRNFSFLVIIIITFVVINILPILLLFSFIFFNDFCTRISKGKENLSCNSHASVGSYSHNCYYWRGASVSILPFLDLNIRDLGLYKGFFLSDFPHFLIKGSESFKKKGLHREFACFRLHHVPLKEEEGLLEIFVLVSLLFCRVSSKPFYYN